ncbi:MAG: NosD domain-containing protein [Promethearchaeota archaeon]
MKNKKVITLYLVILFSIQFLAGLTWFYPNTREKSNALILNPEVSDVIVGNYTFPGITDPPLLNESIRIGLLDDLEHITGDHAWKGALLAAREINEAGGILINSTTYYIGLVAEDTDELNSTLSISKGITAANKMLSYDPHYIIGGFENKSLTYYLEPILDAQIPFLSTGTTSEDFCLKINDTSTYERYKYFFNIMPLNATSIGIIVINQIAWLCSNLGITNLTILREDIPWSTNLANALYAVLGVPNKQIISFPLGTSESEFETIWDTIDASETQLTIPLVNGNDSITMLKTYRNIKPQCILAGIDLFSQIDSFWDDTEGTCQYEIIMQSQHRNYKTSKSIPFWDSFYSTYNIDPYYTGIGSYDAVNIIANISETIKIFDANDTVIALEDFNRTNPFIAASANIAFTKSHALWEGWPYSYSCFCQWQLDGNKVVIPSYVTVPGNPGYYPNNIATGSVSFPYWGVHYLKPPQDIPGVFSLNTNADVSVATDVFIDTDGTFNLTWSDSTGVDNYSVFIFDRDISYISKRYRLNSYENVNSPFTISDLENGDYYFIVAAYNESGEKLSNTLNIQVYDESFYNESTGLWEESPIIIDDTGGGDYNWSAAVATFPWCSGSGTVSDPYIIDSIQIDGQASSSCLTIRNSYKSFTVDSSSFINSVDTVNDGGIKLQNVSSGLIANSNCSSNNGNGIVVYACQNIIITKNTLNSNGLGGIRLYDSYNITINDNDETINNNEYGIWLDTSNNNTIKGNSINNNYYGIYLQDSSYNRITQNYFSGNTHDIEIQGSSTGNIITDNTFISDKEGIPFELILIIIIVAVIAVAGAAGAVVLRKKISSPDKKEKEISDKKKEKIKIKLEEKLHQVDNLINERKIQLAYRQLGKIKDTADQYDFYPIFNRANDKVEKCKEIEAGLYQEVQREVPSTPVLPSEVKVEKETTPKRRKEKEVSVFLSYSTADEDRFQIDKIAQVLENTPEINRVYYYLKDSGQNIVDYMEKTLRVCNTFVLFCTQHSKESKAVEGEWQAAYQLVKKDKMKIIPVYEDEEDVPILLITMLNVKYDRTDFDGFLNRLRQEILR